MSSIHMQTGVGFELRRGQVLRVIDPEGEQVANLFAFQRGNGHCWLCSGRSIDHAGKTRMSTGDLLYSNDSRLMFTIVGDTVGVHDFLISPCSRGIVGVLYGCTAHQPSCFENLANSLARFGIRPSQIHTTFNMFMDVRVDPGGRITVHPPRSKAGDWIELRAEMDLWCGLAACSTPGSTDGMVKPFEFTIAPRST